MTFPGPYYAEIGLDLEKDFACCPNPAQFAVAMIDWQFCVSTW